MFNPASLIGYGAGQVDPRLAAASGMQGAPTYYNNLTPTADQSGALPPFWDFRKKFGDPDFREALGEAWMNNDLAAGYAEANKGSPAPTGKVGQQRRLQPWEMPRSLFATSPMSYNPLIQRST